MVGDMQARQAGRKTENEDRTADSQTDAWMGTDRVCRLKERQKMDRQTDRQTDRETLRRAERRDWGQTMKMGWKEDRKLGDRQEDRQLDGKKGVVRDRQCMQAAKKTDRQTGRMTGSQTDGQNGG